MTTAAEPRIGGSVILTFSGRYLNPLDLKAEDIDTEDIAHALSNQCRYSGHTREFYSVAQHCVLAERWVRENGGSVDEQRWALLHDATEAYLVDIPRPLKEDPYFGKTYRGAEDRAMAVIVEAFALEARKMPAIVKQIDVILLATERRDLMPQNGVWEILDGIDPIQKAITAWSPKRAKREFLAALERQGL